MIVSEFGINSMEFVTSIKLLDEVLNDIIPINNDYSYQLLLLPPLKNEETIIQSALISRFFPQLSLKNYPHIYLDNVYGEEKSQVCNRIRELVQSPTTSVFCMFSASEVTSRFKRSIDEFTPMQNDTIQDFFQPVFSLHLYLWFFLFLTGAMIYSVYLLVGIESDQGINATSSYVQKTIRK